MYIGEVHARKYQRYCGMMLPSTLSLATLGGETQQGSFLFMSHCPKRPR